jgi:hypothetical protein
MSSAALSASSRRRLSPVAETGCAAPMCVPGAMTATSAAIVMTKPAEAARAPEGPTKTTTGAREVIMRETIVRVESTSPPGVRRTKITASAPAVSASSMTLPRYSAEIGWMMPSSSATYTIGRRSRSSCALRQGGAGDERQQRHHAQPSRHTGIV